MDDNAVAASAVDQLEDADLIEGVLGMAKELLPPCQQALNQASESFAAVERSLESLSSKLEANDKRRTDLLAAVAQLQAAHDREERASLLSQVVGSVDKVASLFVFGEDRRKHSSFPSICEDLAYGDLNEEEQMGYERFCAWLETFGLKPNDLISRTNLLRWRAGDFMYGTPEQQQKPTREELVQWARQLGAEEAESVEELLSMLEGFAAQPDRPLYLSIDKVNETIQSISV